MSRSYVFRASVVFVIAACHASFAWSWNAAGHKIVAEIAWRKLDAATQSKVVEILRKHPRFNQDFKPRMNSEVGQETTAVKDHWIFCHAAVWPDIARSQPNFHRDPWHYINLPVFSSEEEADAFGGQLPVNVSFDPATTSNSKKYNGVQSVKKNLQILTSTSSTGPKKAVACSWILHVIPDLAQPLHCSALFSAELFPTGDHGGGRIDARDPNWPDDEDPETLHHVWDRQLGTDSAFDDVTEKAGNLINEYPAEFNASFVALPVDVWATEGQQLAIQWAYAPLMDAVREAEDSNDPLDRIELSDEYLSAAQKVAERQAVVAGVRLAGVLKQTVQSAVPVPLFANKDLGFPGLIAPKATPHMSAAGRAATPPGAKAAEGDRASDMAARVAQLEAEVRILRAALGSQDSRARVMAQPAISKRQMVTQALSTMPEGDEERDCGCGDEE
jgi:hypothetical protein